PVIDRQGQIYIAASADVLATSGGRVVVLSSQGHILRQWAVPTDAFSTIALRQKGQGAWIYYLTTKPDPEVGILCLLRPNAPVRQVVLARGGAVRGLAISEKEN